MFTLRRTINRYLVLMAAVSIAAILVASVCIQRSLERRHTYDSAAETLSRIEKVMKATEKNELSEIFSLFRVNPNANYFAINGETGEIVGSTIPGCVKRNAQEVGLDLGSMKDDTHGFSATVNGQKAYCVSKKVEENYLVRSIAEATLYRRVPEAVIMLAACLALSVIVLCVGAAVCTNRFVISRIKEVNKKLYSIAMGNLDEKIDLKSSVEFAELSRYLNIMIESLLNSNKKMSYVLSKTNMYIGVYEYNESMKRVRYTEYLPSLLALDGEQMERIASDYSLFKEHIDAIRSNPVLGMPGVYRLSEGSSQCVQLEEAGNQNDILGVVILMEGEKKAEPLSL